MIFQKSSQRWKIFHNYVFLLQYNNLGSRTKPIFQFGVDGIGEGGRAQDLSILQNLIKNFFSI